MLSCITSLLALCMGEVESMYILMIQLMDGIELSA